MECGDAMPLNHHPSVNGRGLTRTLGDFDMETASVDARRCHCLHPKGAVLRSEMKGRGKGQRSFAPSEKSTIVEPLVAIRLEARKLPVEGRKAFLASSAQRVLLLSLRDRRRKGARQVENSSQQCWGRGYAPRSQNQSRVWLLGKLLELPRGR